MASFLPQTISVGGWCLRRYSCHFGYCGGLLPYPLYLAPWFAQQQEVFTTPTVFNYSADGEQLYRTDAEQAESGIMNSLDTKLSELLVRS